MGCDISIHIEVKKDGAWHHYASPRVDRDYALFTLMVGDTLGRRPKDMAPTAGLATQCRDIPEDASFVTRRCYEHDKKFYGTKCTCVLPADRVQELQDQYTKYLRKPAGDLSVDLEWSILHTFVSHNALCLHEGWDDLRLVCWFV